MSAGLYLFFVVLSGICLLNLLVATMATTLDTAQAKATEAYRVDLVRAALLS